MAKILNENSFSWLDKIVSIILSVISGIAVVILFVADVKNTTKTNANDIQNVKDNFSDFKSDIKDDVKEIKEDIEYVRKLIENKHSND
jgi:uncharacterized membrane-anchored protein YhcB (DUF1043 family)